MMATQIILKVGDAPAVSGGKALMAFDQNGDLLPNVVALRSEVAAGERPTVVLEITVDGKSVRFE